LGRFVVRRTVQSRPLRAEDYLNGAALIVMLAWISCYTAYFPLFYYVEESDEVSDEDVILSLRVMVALSLLFWTIFFAVKLSFLWLYKSIFWVSGRFMKLWRIVLVIVIISYFVNFLSPLWACGSPQHLGEIGKLPCECMKARANKLVLDYCSTKSAHNLRMRLVAMSTALHLATDVMSESETLYVPS
jgi:hypothetical protein